MKSLIANVTRRAATNEPRALNEQPLSILVAMSYPAVLRTRLFNSELNSCVKYRHANVHQQTRSTLLAHPGVSLLLAIFEPVPKKLKDLKIQDSNLCDNQSGDLIGHGTRSHCSTLQRNGLVGHFGAYSIELLVVTYELCGLDSRRLQASCKKFNQLGLTIPLLFVNFMNFF